MVFTVVVLLDIVFQLLLVIALAKWLIQNVFYLTIINVLIFCLFKLPRGACALSLQVLNTVSIQATFCVQLVFESLFFKQTH